MDTMDDSTSLSGRIDNKTGGCKSCAFWIRPSICANNSNKHFNLFTKALDETNEKTRKRNAILFCCPIFVFYVSSHPQTPPDRRFFLAKLFVWAMVRFAWTIRHWIDGDLIRRFSFLYRVDPMQPMIELGSGGMDQRMHPLADGPPPCVAHLPDTPLPKTSVV